MQRPAAEPLTARYRIALDGDRFRWKAGTKPQFYGLDRLTEVRKAGEVVLVEGESDVHTLWHHGIPALGMPGAGIGEKSATLGTWKGLSGLSS